MLNEIITYPYLEYKNSKLRIYDKTLEEIASKFQTPFFIYLPERFQNNVQELKDNLSKHIPSCSIFYALKANYIGEILKNCKNLNVGVEAMSLFELKLAEYAGIPSENIILNGPAKTQEELDFAINNKIKAINVDSLNELVTIEKLAEKLGIVQPITVRIHPRLDEKTEKKLLIKKNSKLGIDYSRGKKLFEYAKKSSNLEPVGVHTHVGTNLTSHDFYDELLKFVNEYILELETENNIQIREINLGGGLANKAVLDKQNFKLEEFGKQIASTIDNIKDKEILLEPGRMLIEDSFVAVTRVIRTKKSWGRKWAFTDIGANSLIPLRYSHYKVIPEQIKGKDQYTNIGGPLCLPVDIITDEAVSFEIEEKDLLVILNCGAYTLSMSEQFGYPRPAVYSLDSLGKELLIKPADEIEDMINEAFYSN